MLPLFLLLAFIRVSTCYQNAVYYPSWGIYARNYHPQDLPVDKISHVLYAFVDVRASGEVYSKDTFSDLENRYETDLWNEEGNNAYGCVKQLFLLKQQNRGLKTLLSIGGWTYSANFTTAASTEEGRKLFARSSVSLMKDWGFDGIDIDWEYPSNAEESANFVLLLQAVRCELDNYAKNHLPMYHYLLTIASPAGPDHYRILDLGRIAEIVDTFYLMGYDYAGPWSRNASHQANLYAAPGDTNKTPFSTDAAVSAYLEAGVPASNIVLGMPLYGRDFQFTAGIGGSFQGVGEGSWERGVWSYTVLPLPGADVILDEVQEYGAAYSYDGQKRILISYDTPEVVERKVAYIKEKGLGGSMFWEASGDKTDEGSLISTSFKALGQINREDSENRLEYCDGVYDNIGKERCT